MRKHHRKDRLKKVLNECKKTAKIGYRIASTQEKNLRETLSKAKEKVSSTLIGYNSSPCKDPKTSEQLENQLKEIHDAINGLSSVFNEDLQNLRENLKTFSVTLFGRTMAGKSTLMEILTEGDGTSIGKGAQRTTRDIRQYVWNGLTITDVPGIGAFEGEDDEQKAFEAAKKADLVLFLITDDAPQAAEAECFSRIVNLGKPIICIMNVKAAMSEEKSLKLALRDINNRFDMKRLNKIRDQFLCFSEQFGQTWNHIPFVYVHLKSAYMSQNSDDVEKKERFHEISKIDYLKEQIINQVCSKGQFYRIKTFVDIISNPILESMEKLLKQSQINSGQGRTLLTKKRDLFKRKKGFVDNGKNQIEDFITEIKDDLYDEIELFVEEHFDDKNANDEWNKVIMNRGVDEKCQELLKSFNEEINKEINEISREITSEMNFFVSIENMKNLHMNKIFDGKKVWNWSSIIISSGLSIASCIAFFAGSVATGPLGWVTLATSVIGGVGAFLFKSREKKEDEARKKLRSQLKEYVDKVCNNLKKQVEKQFNTLVSEKIDGLMEEMGKIHAIFFQLADTQRNLAWELNNHLLKLNNQILTEAIRMLSV